VILLLGGTSETAPIATGLAQAGYQVLVSTATEIVLDTGIHPQITRRQGRLNEEDMVELCGKHGIAAIVDATHPFAAAVHITAQKTAQRVGIPCITFSRPAVVNSGILQAASHEEAANVAFSLGSPVLLTTGSRNLEPYLTKSHATGLPLFVRVLNEPESLAACRKIGIAEPFILTGRGPFSVEENRLVMKKYQIGVLITKDSGTAGGIEAKLAAAQKESCRVVVIQRPPVPCDHVFNNITDLLAAISALVSRQGR